MIKLLLSSLYLEDGDVVDYLPWVLKHEPPEVMTYMYETILSSYPPNPSPSSKPLPSFQYKAFSYTLNQCHYQPYVLLRTYASCHHKSSELQYCRGLIVKQQQLKRPAAESNIDSTENRETNNEDRRKGKRANNKKKKKKLWYIVDAITGKMQATHCLSQENRHRDHLTSLATSADVVATSPPTTTTWTHITEPRVAPTQRNPQRSHLHPTNQLPDTQDR